MHSEKLPKLGVGSRFFGQNTTFSDLAKVVQYTPSHKTVEDETFEANMAFQKAGATLAEN